MKSRAGERGFALLIVLWSLSLLAMLESALLATARQDTELARNLREAAELRAAAHGAMQQAIFHSLDHWNQHWMADGEAHAVRIGRVIVAVRIIDEHDKVDLNAASPALLNALLLQLSVDPVTAAAVANSIAAWRLAGGTPGRPDPTAARYVSAGLAYAPSGAPFSNLDELDLVLGMTPDLLRRLRPHVTVYTDDDPDLSTRDQAVAAALVAADETDSGAARRGVGSVVSVVAEARGAGAARFAAREVVRLNAKPEGRRYDILDYETNGLQN